MPKKLPNLPALAYFIIDLDIDNLPPPESVNDFKAIVKLTDSAQEYSKQFIPLIMVEAIAVLKTALDKEQKNTTYTVNIQEDEDERQYFYDENASMLTLLGEKRIDCVKDMSSSRFIVAVLEFPNKLKKIAILDIFPEKKKTRLVISGDVKLLLSGNRIDVTPLSSLVNLDRMYDACYNFRDTPLLRQIRCAEVNQFLPLPAEFDQENLAQPPLFSAKLNREQKQVVDGFSTAEEGVYLLQGPPGTGKTTTIISLLQTLINQGERVLVCAPSNKAVHVLTERMKQADADLPMIFVGVEARLTEELKQVSHNEWLARYPNKIPKLLANIDILHSVLGADDATCVFNRQTNTINRYVFQRYKNTIADNTKELMKIIGICKRYLTTLMVQQKNNILQNIRQKLEEYVQSFDNILKLNYNADFPSLGQTEKNSSIQADNTDVFSALSDITRKMRKLLNEISNFIDLIIINLPKNEEELLRCTRVVFCTLSVSGRNYLKYLCYRDEPFNSIIVDEAGQAIEAETLIPFHLAKDARKVLLVGDTRQLPATTISLTAQETHFEWSMIWRMIEENQKYSHMLNVQYRMREVVNHFPSNRYYDGKLLEHASIKSRKRHSEHFIPMAGLNCWVDIKGREEPYEKSFINRTEIQAILETVKAIRKKDPHSQIGIIAFYSGQVMALNKALKNNNLADEATVASTVDSFQGDEKEIIIISFVRANDQRNIGFLRDFRRLNVAITRAKDALLVFGDKETFLRARGNEMQELLAFYQKTDSVKSLGSLLSEIHSKQKEAAESAKAMPEVKPLGHVTGAVFKYVKTGKVVSVNHKKPQLKDVYSPADIPELLSQAKILYDQMKYEESIRRCQTALEFDAQCVEIYEHIAQCHEAMEDNAEAQMHRDIANSLKTGLNKNTTGSAASQGKLRMPAVVAPQHSEQFRPASKNQKKQIKDYLLKARQFSNEKDYKEATHFYELALTEDPMNAEALVGLGWVYHKQRLHRDAIKYFDRSLKINETPLVFQGLMQCYYYMDDIEMALSYANQCMDLFPWSRKVREIKVRYETEYFNQTGKDFTQLEESLKNIDSAGGSISEKAAQKDHVTDDSYRLNIPASDASSAAAASSFWARSQAIRHQASEPLSSKPPAHLWVRQPDRRKAAESDIRRAESLCHEERRPGDAEKIWRDLLEFEPKNPRILYGLAWSLFHQQKYKDAIAFFIESLEYKREANSYYGLAKAYHKCNQAGEALGVISNAIEIYKNQPHLVNNIVKLKKEITEKINQKKVSAVNNINFTKSRDFKQSSDNGNVAVNANLSGKDNLQNNVSKDSNVSQPARANKPTQVFPKIAASATSVQPKPAVKLAIGSAPDESSVACGVGDIHNRDDSKSKIDKKPSQIKEAPVELSVDKERKVSTNNRVSNTVLGENILTPSGFENFHAHIEESLIEDKYEFSVENLKKAMAILDHVLLSDKKEGHVNRRQIISDLLVEAMRKREDYSESLEAIAKSLQDELKLSDNQETERSKSLREKRVILKNEVDLLYKKAVEYYKKDQIKDALPLFKRVLKFNQQYFAPKQDEDVATAHWSLSSCYMKLQAYKESTPHAEKAYHIRSNLLGDKHPQTIKTKERVEQLKNHTKDDKPQQSMLQRASMFGGQPVSMDSHLGGNATVIPLKK